MSIQHLHMEWAQSLLRLSLSSLISVIQFHPSLNNPTLKKKGQKQMNRTRSKAHGREAGRNFRELPRNTAISLEVMEQN